MCEQRLLPRRPSVFKGWLVACIAVVGILVESVAANAQLKSAQEVEPIRLPIEVDTVHLLPDDVTAFLLDRETGDVLLVDLLSRVWTRTNVGVLPTDVVIDSEGQFAYAVGMYGGDEGAFGLAQLSLRSQAVTVRPLAGEYRLPAVDVDGSGRVVITSALSTTLEIIDRVFGIADEGTRIVTPKGGPFGDVSSPKDGAIVFLAKADGSGISVVDGHTLDEGGRLEIYSTYPISRKYSDVHIVGPGVLVVVEGASGLLRQTTSVLYAMYPENYLVLFDYNRRFRSLDVVQLIDLVFSDAPTPRELRVSAADGSSMMLVASDSEQKFILVGNRGSRRVVWFFRTEGAGVLDQRGEAEFGSGVLDIAVSRSGRAAVVLTGRGDVLEVVRDRNSVRSVFVAAPAKQDLRVVQAILATQGYAIGAVDGIDGPQTRAAVTLFQRRADLPETGRVDESTFIAVLKAEIRLTRELAKLRPGIGPIPGRALTLEPLPVDWIGTQYRLGNALGRLAERQADTSLWGEAVDAYGTALKEASRVKLPVAFQASLENNLCFARAQLGTAQSDRGLLEKAVSGCKSALEMIISEGSSEDLGAIYHSLGFVLARLGELTENKVDLEEAIKAFRKSIENFEMAGARAGIALAQRDLEQAVTLSTRLSGQVK